MVDDFVHLLLVDLATHLMVRSSAHEGNSAVSLHRDVRSASEVEVALRDDTGWEIPWAALRLVALALSIAKV